MPPANTGFTRRARIIRILRRHRPHHSDNLLPVSNGRDHAIPPPDVGDLAKDSLPSHWDVDFALPKPFNLVARVLFRVSLVASLGHADLKHVWWATINGEPVWLANKDRLSDRIVTLTIVAGLLISVTAAFITTTPPIESLLDYNQRASYYLLLISFSITLGGLIIGSAMVFVLAKCTARWCVTTLFASRSRIFCTVIIIGYPFLAVGASTSLLAAALITAAINSNDVLMRVGSAVTLAIPVSLFAAFLWTQIPLGKQECDPRIIY